MQLLKADTETKVVIGPVVAVGDGFTPITTLAVSTADEAEIMTHDAAAVTDISANTFAAITSADGYYNLTITAGQLATEGRLTVLINDDSLCLPVRHDFMVVNANVYDSLYGAATTDYLQVDAVQIASTTQDATDLADFAAAGYDPATNKVQGVVLADTVTTLTGHTAQTGDTYALANGAAGFVAIDTVVDAIKAVTDDWIDGARLDLILDIIAADTTTDIPALIATAQADLDIITGADGVNLLTATQASIDAIETDTGTTLQAELDAIQAAVITNAAGVDIAADIIALKAETALIVADTSELQTDDYPTSIAAIQTVVDNLNLGIIYGTAQTGTLSTTVATTDLTGYADDELIGRVIVFTSGTAVGQASDITDYASASGTVTYTAITTAPLNNDTFKIV